MKLTDKQVANIAFIQQLEIPLTQKDEEQIDLIFTDTKANVRQIKITKMSSNESACLIHMKTCCIEDCLSAFHVF